TPNGLKSYWARGNGWVFAAHVRVLQSLPKNDPHRQEYIETFQKMAAALKDRQREDGFWNVSLDDPNDHGGPETSGTSFFTYGIAWGINNAILDSATYMPVVQKAWAGLTSIAIHEDGFLGYVQGVGSNPSSSQPVTEWSTADFGVGAFLLAGNEVGKLASGEMPEPVVFYIDSTKVIDNNHVQIFFNEPLNETSGTNISNYNIDSLTIENIELPSDGQSSILTVSTIKPGKYQLTIQQITSTSGHKVEDGETSNFVFTDVLHITASGFEKGTENTPDKTMDFDLNTRWSVEGDSAWIRYDLGEVKTIGSVDLAFFNGNMRFAYFSISLSNDGVTYSEVFNGQSSGSTLDLEKFDFADQDGRYVKITGFGNSSSDWNSITEARINTAAFTATTDIKQEGLQLSIYPNPYSGGILHVRSKMQPGSDCQLQIFDLVGRKCFNNQYKIHKPNKLDIRQINLPPGLYELVVIKNITCESKLLKIN
ncbi:MAG TPA: glycoside hydrolase family 88 protein, partial [Sunxiuqinia sp.]|nr:glycoside hydrolase family 88 protein [Sunxiuqinia sp.]